MTINQLFQTCLKLFRRCKLIELELEEQFKYMDYLAEAKDNKLLLIDQMRLVSEQVIPLLGDDFCEAIVLVELSQLANRSQLKRKEAFYKYLAMKKVQSCES